MQDIVRHHIDFAGSSTVINLNFIYANVHIIAKLMNNNQFLDDVVNIINIIININNSGKYDSHDILLLKQIFDAKDLQLINITNFCLELFNAIMLSIAKINKKILKLDPELLFGIFFGILVCSMLKYGESIEDKQNIINIITGIYWAILNNEAYQIIDNIIKKTKNRNIFQFIMRKPSPKAKADLELLKSKYRVKEKIQIALETIMLHNTIRQLRNINDQLVNQLENANEQLICIKNQMEKLLNTNNKQDIESNIESNVELNMEQFLESTTSDEIPIEDNYIEKINVIEDDSEENIQIQYVE